MPRGLVWVPLLVVAIVRTAIVFGPGAFLTDPDSYQKVASDLLSSGSFSLNGHPTAYRPPLYPLLLAGVQFCCGQHWRLGVAVLHLAMGLSTVLLAAWIAERIAGEKAALVAVLLVGLDPILLHSSRLVMTETTAAFLSALVLWLAMMAASYLTAAMGLAVGVVLGACVLTRPPFLVWPFFALGVGICLCGGLFDRGISDTHATGSNGGPLGTNSRWCRVSAENLLWALALIGGMACALFPWALRNWAVLGAPVLTTTHGGYTFYLANNPDFYCFLRGHSPSPVWDAAEFNRRWEQTVADAARGHELTADRLAYDLAWQTIREQPGMFVLSCGYRLWQFWRVIPHQLDVNEPFVRRLSRWVIGVFYLVEYLAVVLGLMRLTRHFRGINHRAEVFALLIWGLGLVVGLSVVHTFYWSNMRMRAPVMPVLAIWAAIGIEEIGSRVLPARNGQGTSVEAKGPGR